MRADFLVVPLLAIALVISPMSSGKDAVARAATMDKTPAIDAEVRRHVAAGRARVLVQLRVPDLPDRAARDRAIADAQDGVLGRVPAVLVRRYVSVPLLALEIDAAGLRALEGLGDIVTRVDPDRPVTPR
jgi:hypothetical protein